SGTGAGAAEKFAQDVGRLCCPANYRALNFPKPLPIEYITARGLDQKQQSIASTKSLRCLAIAITQAHDFIAAVVIVLRNEPEATGSEPY
ncbi:MAG: hypothetical protein ABL931_10610, partial [Usitatibacteraceae bacterium]